MYSVYIVYYLLYIHNITQNNLLFHHLYPILNAKIYGGTSVGFLCTFYTIHKHLIGGKRNVCFFFFICAFYAIISFKAAWRYIENIQRSTVKCAKSRNTNVAFCVYIIIHTYILYTNRCTTYIMGCVQTIGCYYVPADDVDG